jgi:hypothetical protein
MINVTRDLESPESLNTPAIQAYLKACQQYEADQQRPQEERTIAKPECNSPYRTTEVLEALHQVFLGKCYLTEKVFESVNEIEIDHFMPRLEKPSLKYAWANLYASDHKANISKPKITPPGGYLDPCNPDDVEAQILYALSMDDTPNFRARDTGNQKAVNTAILLNRLHKDLKKAIQDKHNAILKMMAEWGTAQKNEDRQRVFELEVALKEVLSRKSNFTMLIRSSYIVRRLPSDFFD